MAFNARIKCKRCAFRLVLLRTTLSAVPCRACQKTEFNLKLLTAERNRAAEAQGERATSVRAALAGLSLSVLLSSLGTSVASVALPTLMEVFGASFQAVQWTVLAYLLAITSLVVGAGRLGDLVGRRRLLLAGVAVFTLASAMCAAAPTLPLLIAARAAQGVGAAVMMALTLAFVGETVPKARAASATGLLGAMSATGTALGPSLCGALIAGPGGWRSIFLINVPLGLLTVFLAYRHLPDGRRAHSARISRFDAVGTLLLAVTLAAYALAMTMGRATFGLANAALLMIASIGFFAFILAERRAASPLIPLARFRDRALSTGLATNALVSTVMMATLIVGPFYLSRSLGLDAAAVGLALSAGPLASALAGVPAGRLADRFGRHPMTFAGLIGMAAGAVMLAVAPSTLGIAGYTGRIVILTVGYAMFQAANNATVMADVSSDQRGVISGLLNLSRHLGLITGASAMGALFALGASAPDVSTASPSAVAAGMRVTFAVAAMLMAVAAAIWMVTRSRAR